MWRLIPRAALIIASIMFGTEANCQTSMDESPPFEGKFSIETNKTFHVQKGAIAGKAVLPRDAYVNLNYTIGDANDPKREEFIKETVEKLADSIPNTLGSEDGSYTVTIKVSDALGKNLITEPIVTFQWVRKRVLFWLNTVKSVQNAGWDGPLVKEMLVTGNNRSLKVSIEASFQQNRSLDFDLLKKTAATASSGALASLLPLPSAVSPFVNAVTDFLSAFYNGSKTISLTQEFSVNVGETPSPLDPSFTFKDKDGREIEVPIFIAINTIQSELVSGNLTDGKFSPGQISGSTFQNTMMNIGGQSMSVVDVLESADYAAAKRARVMLDPLAEGKEYGKDPANRDQDINARCGDLYDALGRYLTKADTAGMFWSFLQRYEGKIDKGKCVGNRQAELLSFGLTP